MCVCGGLGDWLCRQQKQVVSTPLILQHSVAAESEESKHSVAAEAEESKPTGLELLKVFGKEAGDVAPGGQGLGGEGVLLLASG